jgi:hypothetical protein
VEFRGSGMANDMTKIVNSRVREANRGWSAGGENRVCKGKEVFVGTWRVGWL